MRARTSGGRFFLGRTEGAAGHCVHHKESNGDEHDGGQHTGKQTFDDVFEHWLTPHFIFELIKVIE
jgi:hypothetical protein